MYVNLAIHSTGTKNFLSNLIIGLYRDDGNKKIMKKCTNLLKAKA